jgi:hypothetical protein
MKITIETLPIEQMRWHGLGDYYETIGDTTRIYVAETGNELYNRFIAIHELIENTLLMAHGIPVRKIDTYCDKIFAEGESPDSESPDSPIHKEHIFSDACETLVAIESRVDLEHYDEACNELLQNKKI